MVLPGQFLERPVVIQCGAEERVLEGLYHKGEKTPVLLAPPHPMLGGSMDAPVLNEIAFACYKEKFPSLRFNYRGVGASQGTMSPSVDDAAEDMAYALDLLLETCERARAVIGGYSFGAMAAGKLAMKVGGRAKALLLVSPPVDRMDCSFLREIDAPAFIAVGERDDYGPPEKVRALFKDKKDTVIREIAMADHFFSRGLADLGREVRTWLGSLGK